MRRYGHARPIISTEHAGHRLVAVGNQIHFSKSWKTFHDFLGDYIKQCIDPEWGNAELRKPFVDRNPIVQWYHHVCDLQQRSVKEPGKPHSVVATGPVMAYLSLAYDLYTLQHHGLLQARLVTRLKRKDQFQGARYETYVAAAFIRAGFDIELEDETDSSGSHCEFTATHKASGNRYSVEAKSRHRPGFLGQPGTALPVEKIDADVYRLLQDALRKRADHGRIIFIDVNTPPRTGGLLNIGWAKKVAGDLRRLEEKQLPDNPWPAAFVFFTNHPYHYVDADEPEPGRAALLTALNMPDFRQDNAAVLEKYPAVRDLFNSVINHTKVPHEL